MLIDEITIKLKAGNGGNGAVGFNSIPRHLGPTGSTGGNGASIYVEGVPDITALTYYRSKPTIVAPNGKHGSKQLKDGENAKDVILPVPIGTVVTNVDSQQTYEITAVGERIQILKGGLGGRGNYRFRGSTNTSPYESEEGQKGEEGEFRFDLKLIADVGLIGLPNAGKSSLLNALTKAKAKVGNYAFTTLEPNLGSYYGLIIADIPGLIEGASAGKGLGVRFLKHVERTDTLVHLVSAESEDPLADYATIRTELERYSIALAGKREYVFISKSDTVAPEALQKTIAAFKKKKIIALPLSILDDTTLDALKTILNTLKK